MCPKHWLVASTLALTAAACGTSDNRLGGPADMGAAATLSTMAGSGGPGGEGRDGGGHQPPEGESGSNNISYPIILSDNVAPSSLPADGAWKFASIAAPTTECISEDGVDVGTAVDPGILCYYGRKVVVTSETGAIGFVGDPCPSADCKVWWLQQRPANFWKALSVGHDASTPLVVSAVDVGDLLESSPSVATRQIRVEFNLLQHVDPLDAELGEYVVSASDADAGAGWTAKVPSPCGVPTASSQGVGCFAAVAMSGAVPGTQQSGSEMQGTDFGPGTGTQPGTVTLIDPATVRLTTPDVGGIEAIVYSRCARLLIQRIGESPTWDKIKGQWTGVGVDTPAVDVAAYRDEYAAEINSGGGLVYGYNWNAKTAAIGRYRLTFVLDGNDDVGGKCTTPLATKLASGTGGTTLVNIGESNPSHIIYAGDAQLGDEGGLAYLDLTLTTKGGGGGKGQRQ